MKVIATNIGKPTTILWNGKEELTGIYKYPTEEAIVLGGTDVENDTVIDRKHHGGPNKACYLFSADQYPYWKGKYPHLDWNWGMFGENLTVKGLDETKLCIGDIYRMGSALVQVSQPREPCYKLGIRFGTQEILRQYIDHGHPGTYVRILEAGKVNENDSLTLVEKSENPLTVQQFYQLIYAKHKDPNIVKLAIENKALPEYKRERLKKYL
ncbi:MOSC domain-containing protein [Maribacter luteus]|uniref:MOSC domain-containing protein n=1 Tax=Maribacter luteus TaxID=2594478 RepID=UPI00248FF0FB|nr:MOSC domain-containing protein [Maribacter luteus]